MKIQLEDCGKSHIWIPFAIDVEIGHVIYKCENCKQFCYDDIKTIENRKVFDYHD